MKTVDEILLKENERDILQKIRAAVKAILPDSSMILFGSRARGDAAADSDWDVLVLTEETDYKIKDRIHSAVYDVELEENAIINPLIIMKDEWYFKRLKDHPIHEKVEAEGVLL